MIKMSINLGEILNVPFDHILSHNSFEKNSIKLKTIIPNNYT